MRVLAVTGMPGSGKGEVVRILGGNARTVVMGDVVREHTSRKGYPLTPGNLGRVANEERLTFGMDIWARRTIERIPGDDGLTVVDGLRSMDEVAAFRREFEGSFRTVAVVASSPVRHARMASRGRSDDAPSAEGHIARDDREASWGISEAITSADHVIENEGTLLDLERAISSLLAELRSIDR